MCQCLDLNQLPLLVRIEEHLITAPLRNETLLSAQLWLMQNGTSEASVHQCLPAATMLEAADTGSNLKRPAPV